MRDFVLVASLERGDPLDSALNCLNGIVILNLGSLTLVALQTQDCGSSHSSWGLKTTECRPSLFKDNALESVSEPFFVTIGRPSRTLHQAQINVPTDPCGHDVQGFIRIKGGLSAPLLAHDSTSGQRPG